jgi:hypothetical protein
MGDGYCQCCAQMMMMMIMMAPLRYATVGVPVSMFECDASGRALAVIILKLSK